MKNLIFLLFLSVGMLANNEPNKTAKPAKAVKSYAKSETNNLNIVSFENEKNGKHIFVVSDDYRKKKITFYNIAGQKVYSIKTIGEPINLNMFVKGVYQVKIQEGNKTIIREIVID